MIPEPATLCETHWKKIISESDKPISVALTLFKRLLDDEKFKIMCGYNPDTGEEANANLINDVMAELPPICCYLGDKSIQEAIDSHKPK